MYKRYMVNRVVTALKDTPAIIIIGPRQCGKTTLVKQLMGEDWAYITLDDVIQLQFAKDDPVGFIQHMSARHVIIDEIQRAPELFLPIKKTIDENRLPGRFLLTGSANALTLPRVADSLAGRLEIVSLLPLAACEMNNHDAMAIHFGTFRLGNEGIDEPVIALDQALNKAHLTQQQFRALQVGEEWQVPPLEKNNE